MTIWIAVNKDQTLCMHTVEPKRTSTKWISSRPYINSIAYKNLSKLIKKSMLSWETEPECIEINIK